MYVFNTVGQAVAHLVEAINWEVAGSNPDIVIRNFSSSYSFRPDYGLGID
jgi:hypothetical protein